MTCYGLALQRAEIRDKHLDFRSIKLRFESWHFAFDAVADNSFNSGITRGESVQARPFVAPGIIPVAMGTVPLEKPASLFQRRLVASTSPDRREARRRVHRWLCGRQRVRPGRHH